MQPKDAAFFDPAHEFSVLERRLPHWEQPGTFAFVTFRLADSLPDELATRFARDRFRLLEEAGLDPNAEDCQVKTSRATAALLAPEIARHGLSPRAKSLLRWKLFCAWDERLDQLRGECLLNHRDTSQVISDGLLKFDGERYVMAAFVVMPNHVHLLAAFARAEAIIKQGTDWRRYFAREVNKQVGRSGHLWQEDQFDHLVRSEASFDRIRSYIIENPRKAGLRSGEYRLYVSPQW